VLYFKVNNAGKGVIIKGMKKVFLVHLFLALFLLSAHSAWAVDIYVDQNADGQFHNGTSWTNAYTDLQSALATANNEDTIYVAQGTYKPGTDRAATFQLINGVTLLGGYPTGGGTRDPKTNVTTLSGDIGTPRDSSDNSYHVVTGSGTNSTARLDGFTVSSGNANSYFSEIGRAHV
jgi:hypothetical protein